MGLALAIDYTLLIISRYRDELADSADPAGPADATKRHRALVRTMTTAGRTVLFSALTVALSMAAMVLFPMYFLQSFAYAGIAVVGFAVLAAIVVAPAAIVLAGDRLDSLDVRRLVRGILGRPEPVRKPVEQMFWYRSTKFVMRRSIPIGLVVVAVLLLLGAPFLSAKWGFPDDRLHAVATPAGQDMQLTGLAQVNRDSAGAITSRLPMVLLFCVAFGLSMDYEVFLVSRIREYWLKSGQTAADNDESVALGLARTGRVVTAAVLLMSISFAALIAAKVAFMRMFGAGNWWAPKPRAKLHERIGLSETLDDDLPDGLVAGELTEGGRR